MNLVTSIDSGDCCLPNKLTEYCTDCSCKILGKKSSDTYLLTYQIPDSLIHMNTYVPTRFALLFQDCPAPSLILDGICDDLTNNEACSFDGGDCCRTPPNFDYCTTCECKTMK